MGTFSIPLNTTHRRQLAERDNTPKLTTVMDLNTSLTTCYVYVGLGWQAYYIFYKKMMMIGSHPEARYLPSFEKLTVKIPALWPVRSAVFTTERPSVQRAEGGRAGGKEGEGRRGGREGGNEMYHCQ